MTKIVVKVGDTLWSIAKYEYGDPNKWRTIYSNNIKAIHLAQSKQGRRHLRGPDWIYPGMELYV